MFGPPQPNAMLQAVDHAVHVYRGDRAAWQIIQRNGMGQVGLCACTIQEHVRSPVTSLRRLRAAGCKDWVRVRRGVR